MRRSQLFPLAALAAVIGLVCFTGSEAQQQVGTLSQPATSAAPSGSAGGDLSGTYPNPTVNNVGLAHLAAGTAGSGTFDFSGSTAIVHPNAAGAAPTAGGDIRYNTTQQCTVAGGNGSLPGCLTRLYAWAHPQSDVLCAHGGDTSISLNYSATCNNAAGTDVISPTFTSFSTKPTIPAGFLVADKMLRVRYELNLWTSATVPALSVQTLFASTQTFTDSNNTPSVGGVHRAFFVDCLLTANSAVGASATLTTGCTPGAWNSSFGSGNSVNPVAIATNASGTLSLGFFWAATGIASGTYTSGGSITGSQGQTCTLSSFNNSNSGGTATVTLTAANTIAGGTALVITNTGVASASAATSATLGSGTATCSGTATVATVLGGAQGNALQLRSVTVEELN